MAFLSSIILFFQDYPFLVSFVGAFFGGEESILSLAYLSGQNILPVLVVFAGCFVGTMASDSFWFYLARHRIIDRSLERKHFAKGYQKVASVLNKSFYGNPFPILLIVKFLYGFRIMTIFYLSREKMNFKKFSYYNAGTAFIWLTVNVTVGWLAGRGFSRAMNILEDARKGLLILVLLIITVSFFRFLLDKWFNKNLT